MERRGNPRYEIVGNVDLPEQDDIFDLGNLVNVDGNLNLRYTQIQSLSALQYVGGYLDLRKTPIQSLRNLEYVGGRLDLRDTPIESLGNLKYAGSIQMEDTKIKSFGNLNAVGSIIYISERNELPEEEINKFKDKIQYPSEMNPF